MKKKRMTNGRTGNTVIKWRTRRRKRREEKEEGRGVIKRMKDTKKCRSALTLLIFPAILLFGE
jgi:hypothetical protein